MMNASSTGSKSKNPAAAIEIDDLFLSSPPSEREHDHNHEQQQQEHREIQRELDRAFRVSTLDTAIHSLQSIVQFHFDKTIEKKRAIDAQKKHLWLLLHCFLVFLALLFAGIAASDSRIQCRHSWAPIALCALGHAAVYAAVAQIVRCLNGLKFQRHCHKLTLGVAAAKLAKLRALPAAIVSTIQDDEFEVPYQEPAPAYYAKFTRRWLVYASFLALTFATMTISVVAILCL